MSPKAKSSDEEQAVIDGGDGAIILTHRKPHEHIFPSSTTPGSPAEGYFERCSKRVRGLHAGVLLFDTHKAAYVWENAHFPVYYVPVDAIQQRGFWRFDANDQLGSNALRILELKLGTDIVGNIKLRVKDKEIRQIYYIFEGKLQGYLRIPFSAIDEWWEEGCQIFGYPRDPYKRIDVQRSTYEVKVFYDDTLVATSHAAQIVTHPGFPDRYYLPPNDVKLDHLRSNGKTVICPYKGVASGYDLLINRDIYDDMAWSYKSPNVEVAAIKGFYCFSSERVTVTLNGAKQPKASILTPRHEMTPDMQKIFHWNC